jgi:hypothetical protein
MLKCEANEAALPEQDVAARNPPSIAWDNAIEPLDGQCFGDRVARPYLAQLAQHPARNCPNGFDPHKLMKTARVQRTASNVSNENYFPSLSDHGQNQIGPMATQPRFDQRLGR